MVTTDISQLNSECNNWIASLRNNREELYKSRTALQEFASRQSSRDSWQNIEHYQNQFQIQLFNIHDVKQAIKEHERIASRELKESKGVSEAAWSKHEELYDTYHQLDQTLVELKDDFKQFIESNK